MLCQRFFFVGGILQFYHWYSFGTFPDVMVGRYSKSFGSYIHYDEAPFAFVFSVAVLGLGVPLFFLAFLACLLVLGFIGLNYLRHNSN